MRILITGGPSTGKTTLGAEFAAIARSTDEVRDLDWDEGSEAVCGWLFDAEGDFVIEGCIVPRALRKFLEESDEKPCDLIIWLSNPKKEQTDEQKTMTKGMQTVMAGIFNELLGRGVDIVGFHTDEDGEKIYFSN